MKNFNSKKIYELLSGEKKSLDSEYEIEDLVMFIDSLDKKVDFFEGLKRNRVAAIDEEIIKIENQKKVLKDIILETLKKNSKKSLKFPGIGKVFIKEIEGKWNIVDEEELIEVLKKELPQDHFDKLVSTKPVIAKREVNEILEMWKKVDKLPTCVSKEQDSASVIVKIDKDSTFEVPETDIGESNNTSTEHFDSVEDNIPFDNGSNVPSDNDTELKDGDI